MNIYNESSRTHYEEPLLEHSTLSKTELLHAFAFPEVEGGLLVEQLLGSEHLALITFMALDFSKRKQGVGSMLIQEAQAELMKEGIMIIGVQLNSGDNKQFWINRGFTDQEYHQSVTVLLGP